VITTVLFDVDGTLVDSNDAHARAWVDAFAAAGVHVEYDAVRRAIGMGGDQLMPVVSDVDPESPLGQQIANTRGDVFKAKYLPMLRPFADADRLVQTVKSSGRTVVTASSAKSHELQSLLKVARVDGLFDAATTSDDAEASKPEPDIVHVALGKAGARAEETILIGDTPYDIAAASRAGVRTIAFRCGGWRDEDLGGAIAIYDGPADLLARFASSPLYVAGEGS